MILRDIIKGLKINNIMGDENQEISGISYDSGKVREGFLFLALTGEKTDGHKYIDQAIDKGAKALIVEKSPDLIPDGVSYIEVGDSRKSLARVSSNFYKNPTQELCLVGITGTNGKTTITYLLESIWEKESKISGVIGTIDYRYQGKRVDSYMTTPESLELMKIMREMKDAGTENVAMEVSSHALDKDRVLGCHFDSAVFTNLTQDHLDYHKTMDGYMNSKKRLFTELLSDSEKENKYAVINIDDPYGEEIVKEVTQEIFTYSAHNDQAIVYAKDSHVTRDGIRASVVTPSGSVEIDSRLFGEHNLSNLLAAVAVSVSLGSSISSIEEGLHKIGSVPGRLEPVDNPFGFSILVDYAHTPDALENVLRASRALTDGKLILVFGCGGDRDKTKRPKMGSIGDDLSDILIVTSDNPRTESPELIIDDIESGISDNRKRSDTYSNITDRARAISEAVSMASEKDTVLIAGKGHEDYQILGTAKHHFDDREQAEKAVNDRMN